jgi:RNA polymerase sigma-70 factor (ECF subfamily)
MPAVVAERAALATLLEEHGPKLLAMLRRRIDPALSARIDAEDVLQEAFLLAWRKWHAAHEEVGRTPYEQKGVTAYVWLYGLCLERLIQVWRRENRAGRDPRALMPFPEHTSMQLALGLVNPEAGPESAAHREELRKRVQQLLQLLSRDDREILWLRHYDGLAFKEVAMVLAIKPATANVRYFRALERLRGLWQKLADACP